MNELVVLVTRPRHQAEKLLQLLTAAGSQAIHFPCMEIVPVTPSAEMLVAIEGAEKIIFISRNAVQCGLSYFSEVIDTKKVFAMGPATASALADENIQAHIPVGSYTSEALLALPGLQDIIGQQIMLVAGEGGRELLMQALQERGANVTKLDFYRRVKPKVDIAPHLKQWQHSGVNCMTVTSMEGLEYLLELLGEQTEWLLEMPVCVISERLAKLVKQRGFQTVWQAEDATDIAVVDCLKNHSGELKTSL